MALNFDTTRAPMRPSDFVDLVRAVVAARSSDESQWLEWKSYLDLGSADGKASVVRSIVGLSNRLPEKAGTHCEGRAYLVIGAEPGKVLGIEEIDPSVLEARLLPYLGGDGPRWQPHWVELTGRTVLVVEVAAPKAGDIVFHLHKAGPGIEDGSIFVRRGSATVPPSSSELHDLFTRAAAAPVLTGVRLWLAAPDHLPPIDFSDEAIEEWLEQTRQACMSSLRAHEETQRRSDTGPRRIVIPQRSGRGRGLSLAELEDLEERVRAGEQLTDEEQVRLSEAHESARRMAETIGSSIAKISGTKPEERTPEEYTAEVDAYLDDCRGLIPSVLRRAAGERLTPTQFVLNNETDDNYPEVEVRLHLEGSVEAVLPFRRAANEGRLPNRPRPYGPRPGSLFGIPHTGLTDILDFPGRYGTWVTPSMTGSTGPSVRIENGGSVTLTFSAVDLRPRQRNVPLATAVLLAHMPAGATARGTWEATSTGVRGIAHGDLQVPITGQPWSVADSLSEDESST